MGTQQILLIVLSVIIVGAAIAVGIEMFNSQGYSSNRSAATADVQLYMTQVLQYYKMPRSLGGMGGKMRSGVTANDVSNFIGWGGELPMTNDNGSFYIVMPAQPENQEIIDIKAICSASKNGKKPVVHSRIFFPDGRIETKVGDIVHQGAVQASDFTTFDLWSSGNSGNGKLGILGL